MSEYVKQLTAGIHAEMNVRSRDIIGWLRLVDIDQNSDNALKNVGMCF
jgi:hypothetical protein